MKKFSSLFLLLIIPFFLGSCQVKHPNLSKGLYAQFTTNHGVFITKLYQDATPLTVANFVSLADGTNDMVSSDYKGKHFYDGIIFHRIIKDFMIQGGDPKGQGTGGPGYKFPDEIVDTLVFNRKGLLAMANSGPETNGSQFFITLAATPHLNGRHTIFGEVVEGQEIVDAIGSVETTKPGDKPVNDVVIQKVEIINVGKIKVPNFSNELAEIEKEKQRKEEAMKKVASEKANELKEVRAKADKKDSGIEIYVHENGDGPQPNIGDWVKLYYAGYLTNGQLFDSNIYEVADKYGMADPQRQAAGGYSPMTSEYSMNAQLIPGFKEAMTTMKVGDKITVFIPPHLAYGERGISGIIPPSSELIFELELVEIAK